MARRFPILVVLACFLIPRQAVPGQPAARGAREPSAADYPSIQAALRANPGRMVYVGPGDWPIAEKIRITENGSGLRGPGRIIQSNPDAPIIEVLRAAEVAIHDLTLTRPEGRMDTRAEGVQAAGAKDLLLENLRIVDNRTCASAIALHGCDGARVRGCAIRNYHRVGVDDRTGSPLYGYAFNCIGGAGIVTEHGSGVLIQGNRVIEDRLRATPEVKDRFHLGQFVKKNPVKGTLMRQKAWDADYTQNWHQGSAIVVNAPEDCQRVQILDNYIENAGQGVDIHADQVTMAQNVICNAHIGMKAMHGSRHILILGNQFIRNDLWSIGLMPGTASHPARSAAEGKPAAADNGDGGSIIANNIISQFGYGDAHWNWGIDSSSPIALHWSDLITGVAPLADVIIQGNVVYDSGRDQVLVDGKPKVEPPRYRYAVRVSPSAKGLHFSNNVFHPGTSGVSNVELKP